MLASITAAYSDTRAADLSWSIGEAPRPVLASMRVAYGPIRLDLCVLGASHQAVLDTPLGRCSEIVACRPGAPGGLPAEVVQELPGMRYTFRAQVRQLSRTDFAAAVTRLRTGLRGHPRAMLGVFPGVVDAVTALQADDGRGGIGWRTWHAYPQTSELVVTRTQATPQ
jgi:hypothetical protein